jgi:peptidoglycan/xylan/chitin deacetylase (PgdA/CDA1 family)
LSARPEVQAMNGSRDLTIVVYHYVRPLAQSRYPGIKGLEVREFKEQLWYLTRNYQPVTVQAVVHSIRTGEALPPRAVLLTFDDGYRDHYLNVFPLLHDLGIQGAFFPPVSAARDGKLLDVNRIHFILASARQPQEVKDDLDAQVDRYRDEFQLPSAQEYWSQYGQPNRFDPAEIMYIKRMLQHGLPESLRQRITRELFSKYVAREEAEFARELYMDAAQLSRMQTEGMYVGSHGVSHGWLNKMSPAEQIAEIEGSLGFLREICSPVDDYWVMCFPNGGWDQTLLVELRNRKCSFGLTTEAAVANLDRGDPLLLPRLDTNDLPPRGGRLPALESPERSAVVSKPGRS